MALQGSLADFGIAEILQLIGSQQKTGILHVTGGSGAEEVMISFSSGRIIRTDVNGRHKRDLLGTMMVAAGAISKDQLAVALKSQKKSLKRLGDVLVERALGARVALREDPDQPRRSVAVPRADRAGELRALGAREHDRVRRGLLDVGEGVVAPQDEHVGVPIAQHLLERLERRRRRVHGEGDDGHRELRQ